ncbi:alpha/beta fold hydrolase [Natronolimnohabitans sp. A-GB9]|uniref:alpha/beta hydrolase n=1 Tax=Natronolimnohabitans sp. A-GB9 TaxID=3069757 RepID=UPI0027ADA3DE|nr:alpha/beta fold hydrolase [Natronolimnohabitans sp. A-GB9]MDQ2052543.1 alpha/beta fold hydrolase [Natronolimnohabitans sp. A-GB9]
MTGNDSPSTPRRAFLAGTVGTVALSTVSGARKRDGRGKRTNGNETAPWQPTAHDLTMDDGHRLRVWERTTAENPDEAVIFVHGMTYGAVPMFDPPVAEEFGWLQYAAEQGQAAFAPDMRGYGETELPTEYRAPPETNTPPLSFEREAMDLLEMTRWLREEQGFDRIHYVGLSGGTWRGRAVYALGDPDYATVTLAAGSFDTLEVGADPDGPAYLPHVREEFVEAWTGEVPADADLDRWIGGDEFTADEVLDAVWRAIFESNQALDDDPETVIAPLVVQDREYHPKHITDPTFVVRPSSDETISREGALNLYDAAGADDARKRYTEIAGGTHFIFLERKREVFFDAVRQFQTRY